MKARKRCAWADTHELHAAYHDAEWGVPSHDDRYLFELLNLEGCMDPKAVNFKTYVVRSAPSACRY